MIEFKRSLTFLEGRVSAGRRAFLYKTKNIIRNIKKFF